MEEGTPPEGADALIERTRQAQLQAAQKMIYDLRDALVKEKAAKEESEGRAEELAELMVQAKASNKKQTRDTTKLLIKAKEQARAEVEAEWADLMAELAENNQKKEEKQARKIEKLKKENKELKKQVLILEKKLEVLELHTETK
eukprot:COSAG06_NODE_10509_length_1669_cov_1.324841_1_plen_143_part_10